MKLIASASWKRIDIKGSDSAGLFADDEGLFLIGEGHFTDQRGSTTVHYSLKTDADKTTLSGSVYGTIDLEIFEFKIERQGDLWLLSDQPQYEVQGLLDLDYGFTPATNIIQMQHHHLEIGEKKEFITAWFDLDEKKLRPLKQIYERISESKYRYDSPQGPYHATLIMADNGFVQTYPGLWEMLDESTLRNHSPELSL